MYDPLALSAIIVSVATLAFVLLEKGVSLPLGYRESPETSARKSSIDSKLRAEVEKEKQDVFKNIQTKDEEEQLETLVKLGRDANFARSITDNLLNDVTRYMSSALNWLLVGLVTFSLTLFVGVNIIWTTDSFLFFAFFFGMTLFAFYFTYRELKRHYFLRERFVRLNENPNLEYCLTLVKEIQNEGMWSFLWA